MKNIKYLFVLVFAAMLSVSCNSDDDSAGNSSDLLGTWGATEVEEGMEFKMEVTFNANKSGNMMMKFTFEGESFTENDNFTWSTSGNKLTITIDGDSETVTYSVSGNKLSITDADGEVSVLTKQ